MTELLPLIVYLLYLHLCLSSLILISSYIVPSCSGLPSSPSGPYFLCWSLYSDRILYRSESVCCSRTIVLHRSKSKSNIALVGYQSLLSRAFLILVSSRRSLLGRPGTFRPRRR